MPATVAATGSKTRSSVLRERFQLVARAGTTLFTVATFGAMTGCSSPVYTPKIPIRSTSWGPVPRSQTAQLPEQPTAAAPTKPHEAQPPGGTDPPELSVVQFSGGRLELQMTQNSRVVSVVSTTAQTAPCSGTGLGLDFAVEGTLLKVTLAQVWATDAVLDVNVEGQCVRIPATSPFVDWDVDRFGQFSQSFSLLTLNNESLRSATLGGFGPAFWAGPIRLHAMVIGGLFDCEREFCNNMGFLGVQTGADAYFASWSGLFFGIGGLYGVYSGEDQETERTAQIVHLAANLTMMFAVTHVPFGPSHPKAGGFELGIPIGAAINQDEDDPSWRPTFGLNIKLYY